MLQLADAGHRVADPPRLEVGERQRQDVAEQLRAEPHVDAVRRMGEEVGAEAAEDRLEDHERDHADREHVERREPPVHQHLVDHDLREQRSQQTEQLKNKRSDQHLAEQLSIFDDGGDEPGEVELQILRTQMGPFRKEQHFAAPKRLEPVAGQDQRTRLDRVLHQHLLFVGLGQDQVTAVGPPDHGGKRKSRQLVPPDRHAARLEPQMFRGAQEIRRRQRLVQPRELMAQLRRVGGQVVEPSENQQTEQPGVRNRRRRLGRIRRRSGVGVIRHGSIIA